MADLSVNIGSLMMSNPVMTASGTFGYGKEFEDFVDLEKIGGIIVKGTTLHHREGNPYPRMAETPMGMLNAVGLQNKGVNYFVEHIYPQIKDINTNMIEITHNGAITRGRDGALPKKALIDYVQKRAPELVKNDTIYLGRLDSSRLLEWRNPNVQYFIKNLLRYAVLRDGFRVEYKKSK